MNQIHKQTIYKAISEPLFAKDIFRRLPLKEFQDEQVKTVVSTINRYYKTNDSPLSESTLLTLVEDILIKQNKSLEKQEETLDVVSDLYKLDYVDQNEEAITEAIQKFVRKTMAREAIMDAVSKGDLSEDSVLNGLVDSLRDVLTTDVGGNNGELLDFFADKDRKKLLLSNLQQNKYPTGFMSVDSIADGGLARGEVGLVVAGTGQGKTSVAVNLARNYILQGLNVLYVPLEEKLDRMVLRMEQLLSQVSKKDIVPNSELNASLFDSIQEAYDIMTDPEREDHWGRLWIRKYRPQELTPSMFSQLLSDVMIRKGLPIDVVILDYPDLMKNPHVNGGNESDAGGKLYEDIRATAQEYDFVCWTLSQTSRTGYTQDIKNAGAIEGSKRKLNAVELAFTLNQNDAEFQNGFLRIYLDKVRNNNGVSYDRMQYLKVIPETMTIRDETPDERVEHENVLELNREVGGDDHKKDTQHTTSSAQGEINGLNSVLFKGR